LVALLLAWAHEPDKFQVVAEKVVHRVTQRPLQRQTPQWHAVLVDFGVAKVLEPVNPRRPRSSSLVAWADGYSPPEQYQSGATVGAQADQYALAATLLFALSGETPPDALTRMALWREGKPDLPFPPFGLPPSVWHAIKVAMSFDPNHRFSSVVTFWEAVQGFNGQERWDETPNHRPIRSNTAPQHERLVRFALLGLLGTLVSALGHWWGGAVIGVCGGVLASVLGLGISQWLKSRSR
jgi:serine/threonine protein kinase